MNEVKRKISFVLLFICASVSFFLNLFVWIKSRLSFDCKCTFNSTQINGGISQSLPSTIHILALKSTRSNQNQSDSLENNEINCETKAHLLRRFKFVWCACDYNLYVCMRATVKCILNWWNNLSMQTHTHTQENYGIANHSIKTL